MQLHDRLRPHTVRGPLAATASLALVLLFAGCAPAATGSGSATAAAPQTFVGVGIALRAAHSDGTGASVIGVIDASPAARAGVPVTDPAAAIVAVDGADVTGLPMPAIVERIKGPEGRAVRLELALPDGGTRSFSLVRQRLEAPPTQP